MSIPSPFAAVDTDFNRSTEFALKLKSTAGYTTLTYGPNFPGSSVATGLANDATAYTATVTVDGVGVPVSVTGSTAQTFANLISQINTDLGVAATAALVGDSIVITSATTGTASLVVVTDVDLFDTVHGTGFGLINTKAVKGADEYVLWNKLDGTTQANVAYTVDSFLAAAAANTNVDWTNGSDAISFPTGTPTSITPTGLTATTVYQLNVDVDGAGGVELLLDLTIADTLNVQHFQHLLNAINIALRAQSVAAVATFDEGVSPLTLRITSNLVGTGSTVVITDGAVNGLLAALAAFGPVNAAATVAGYQEVNVGGNKVGGTATNLVDDVAATAGYQEVNVGGAITGGSATGLTNDATVYTATITVDGVAKPIAVTGSTAQDYTTLLAEINTDLGASATAAIIGGNIRVTSATTGAASTVAIADTDLFATLTDFVSVTAAVPGVATIVTTYTATITVDGVAKPISVDGGTAQTFTTLLNEINTDLGASATAALSGGNIRVTSATTGLTSTVAITAGTLFAAPLNGFVAVSTAVAGTDAAGVDGSTNVTFPVTKDSIVWNNWGEVLNEWSSLLGTKYGPLFTSGNAAHLRKENKPATKGKAVNTYVYWDGAAWKFFDDDATVGAVVNPPEL